MSTSFKSTRKASVDGPIAVIKMQSQSKARGLAYFILVSFVLPMLAMAIPIAPSSTSNGIREVASATLSTLATPTSFTGHHNLGADRLVNSLGKPFDLLFTERGDQIIINAYGPDYNLTDLFTMADFTNQADEPSIPDIDYYAFTTANLAASKVDLFYAYWSVTAPLDPDYETLGEWGVFAKQYMDTRDFLCSPSTSVCHNKLERREIQRLYAGNRPMARLVYFSAYKFTLMHDMFKIVETQIERSHVNIVGRIPDIIMAFTRQPSVGRQQICAVARQSLDMLGQMSMQLVLTFVGAPPIEIVAGGPGLLKSSMKHIFKPVGRVYKTLPLFTKGGFQPWYDNLTRDQARTLGFTKADQKPRMPTIANLVSQRGAVKEGKIKPMHFNLDPLGMVSGNLPGWASGSFHFTMGMLTSDLALDQGYNKGILCGAWEGDDTDRTAANIGRLSNHLSTYFEGIEQDLRAQFTTISRGHNLVPGYPSLTALVGQNLQWEGLGSVIETLAKTEALRKSIAVELEKKVISDTIARDGNWQRCTHRADASKLCEEASLGRAGEKSITNAMKAVVCPRPESDPTLICQGGRWYWQMISSHIVDFAPMQGLESYQSGVLSTTYESAVKEAYENFKLYGNNVTSGNVQSWGTGHVQGNGLRIPICESDYLSINDYGGFMLPHLENERQWDYPAICGPLGKDTEEFMNAVGTGIGSQNYVAKDRGGFSQMLWTDRLPREFAKLDSPWLSYMSFGRTGIQFPLKNNKTEGEKALGFFQGNPLDTPHLKHQIRIGRDESFEVVRKATEGMTEFQATLWFCETGKKEHTVFQRERRHFYRSTFPVGFTPNHEKRCGQWLKKHEVDIEAAKNGEVL